MYNRRLTSVLSGASVSQLSNWGSKKASTPLLEPTRVGIRAFYSYADVVALRMFVKLRKEISLQRIRKAVEYVRTEEPETPLSEFKLAIDPADGQEIVWQRPDGSYVGTVKNKGQFAVKLIMDELFSAFTNPRGLVVPDLRQPVAGVTISETVQGGYPVAEGTRIQFNLVGSMSAGGWPDEALMEQYPGLTPESIRGAREFYERVEQPSPAA